GVDRAHRLGNGAAEVVAADAVLDGDVARVGFAIDHRGAVLDLGGTQLTERDALAGRRQHPDVLDLFDRLTVLRRIADHQVVTLFAVEDLAHRLAADRRLDRVLDVGDVDAESIGLRAIDAEIEVRLAAYAEHDE